MTGTRVLLCCGGTSSEHEVSLASAGELLTTLAKHPTKLQFSLLAIGPKGEFHYDPTACVPLPELLQRPPSTDQALAALSDCEVALSLLHGTGGEDGAFQGFLQTLGVPYVGSGVLASALCMDKVRFREWAKGAVPKIAMCDWDLVTQANFDGTLDKATERIAERLGWPLFVKPACGGSSQGISRVTCLEELAPALSAALALDDKAILEAMVPEPREVEVAILGNAGPETVVSPVGEVLLPDKGWYDYETKYGAQSASTQVPAQIPKALAERLQDQALCVYRAAGCKGLARVDFLLAHGQDIYLNEINTLPGFTSISMYTKLMQAAGVPYPQLVETLVQLALTRAS